MDINNISAAVAMLIALSIASERLVEITKGYMPSLSQVREDPEDEGRRRATIQFIAVVAGIVTTFLAAPALPPNTIPDNWLSKLAIGLLASGGSGFWNSIQGYVAQAKEVKKAQVEDVKATTEERKPD